MTSKKIPGNDVGDAAMRKRRLLRWVVPDLLSTTHCNGESYDIWDLVGFTTRPGGFMICPSKKKSHWAKNCSTKIWRWCWSSTLRCSLFIVNVPVRFHLWVFRYLHEKRWIERCCKKGFRRCSLLEYFGSGVTLNWCVSLLPEMAYMSCWKKKLFQPYTFYAVDKLLTHIEE